MNVLFLCCAYSQNKLEEFLLASKRGYQFAAQNFQESILQGLIENDVQTSVLSIPSLSTWPLGFSTPFIPSHPFLFKEKEMGLSCGYFNVLGLNRVSYNKVKSFICEWIRGDEDDKSILVYGLHVNLMELALSAKRDFPKLHLGIVMPDLPQYMGYNKYLKALGAQKRNVQRVNQMVGKFDSYFPLAKDMMTVLSLNNKPYSVIEGVFSGSFPNVPKDQHKVVLYSGGINRRYGVKDLLSAFGMISNPNFRLWICGTGDMAEEINVAMNKDNRIQFYGQVPHTLVLELQKKATVLVNPRHSYEEFTQYSFPSKTLEYLASGSAVVMSHLKSIPSEYDQYLFYFEDESPEGMSQTIERVCSIDMTSLEMRGKNASEFIYTYKNAKNQVAKILKTITENMEHVPVGN